MDPLQLDFAKDLDQVAGLLDVVDQLMNQPTSASPSTSTAPQSPPAGLPVLVGTLQLYVCGRFEYFVKARFQDMCDAIASRCRTYGNLPLEMKASLLRHTAEAMQDQQRLGYSESDVQRFVLTLAENLGPSQTAMDINSECLSSTSRNMRADMLKELFKRAGANDVWDKLSGQAKLQTLLENNQSQEVSKLARARLDEFITSRNAIAHPTASITWPSTKQLRDGLEFLRVLSETISEVAKVYERTLGTSNTRP